MPEAQHREREWERESERERWSSRTHPGGQVKQDNCQARRQLTWHGLQQRVAGRLRERKRDGQSGRSGRERDRGWPGSCGASFALDVRVYFTCGHSHCCFKLLFTCCVLIANILPLSATHTHTDAYTPLGGKLLYRFRIKVAARVACSGCSIWNAIAASGNISFCNSQGYARPHPGKALENCEKQKAWQAIKIATKPTKRETKMYFHKTCALQKLNKKCWMPDAPKRKNRANKSMINWTIKYPSYLRSILFVSLAL